MPFSLSLSFVLIVLTLWQKSKQTNMRICHFWLVVVTILMLSGCASSRKSQVNISRETSDSLVATVGDSVRKTAERRDSTSQVVSDSMRAVSSLTERGDNQETITEHITERVDAAGNKTTVTDRTTRRAATYDKQADHQEWQRRQTEQTSVWLSWLDSLADSRASLSQTHKAKQDSINKDQERNTRSVTPTAIWRWMEGFQVVFVIVCFYFCYRYFEEHLWGKDKDKDKK